MLCLLSSVNFIEINQVVFECGQVKVSNPLKLILNRKIYRQCITPWKETLGLNKKMQVIKTINCKQLSANSNLMIINFGKLHYQWMPFSYANYSVNLILFIQSLQAIISIISVNVKKNIQ